MVTLAPASSPEDESPAFLLDVPIRSIGPQERAKALKQIANQVARWHSKDPNIEPCDGMVVMTPEGYGKSSLVPLLVARGFKVVFASKSNAQLDEKEEMFKALLLRTARHVSKQENLRRAVADLLPATERFKVATYPSESPYGSPTVNQSETIALLHSLFTEHGLDNDATVFYRTHYESYRSARLSSDADVYLLTFSALQSLCNAIREKWWERLGLIATTRGLVVDDENYFDLRRMGRHVRLGDVLEVNSPPTRVAVIVDDPDRSDVDWLRGVSDQAAARLGPATCKLSRREARERKSMRLFSEKAFKDARREVYLHQALSACQPQMAPLHDIIRFKGRHYVQRPPRSHFGYRLRSSGFEPKLIFTTTEWITSLYALKSMQRLGMKTAEHVDVFSTDNCNVTAVSATITRSQDHAVLLPIAKHLAETFPEHRVELIADGLGCEFNLSNSKGRNDLADVATIIKLSWPHPDTIATLGAHFGDVEHHDLMIATHLADLGNQAIGRNQGFRFRGRSATVLIDPRYYDTIMRHRLLRYQVTPWSSRLPALNAKTGKKKAVEAIRFLTEKSPIQGELLRLIHEFRAFGKSSEASDAADQLPPNQRAKFQEWLGRTTSPTITAVEEERAARRRAKNGEYVRRHRERKKKQRQAP